jgi:hypothetical protein
LATVASALLGEDLPGLVERVDVVVVAVAVVRQLFELGVLQVAHAVAEHGEVDAGLPLLLDEPHQLGIRRDTDVEVAVGGEDDAVDAVLEEAGLRLLVSQDDAAAAVGRALRVENIDGPADRVLRAARRGREQQLGAPRVGDDADAVLRGEFVDQQPQRLLDERQAIFGRHRTGGVDEEDEVAGGHVLLVDRLGAEADAQQVVLGLPGAGGQFQREGDGLAVLRRGVVVVEVIEEVGDAHGILRRQLPGVEAGAGVGVGGGVHGAGDGRERVVLDQLVGVLKDRLVVLCRGILGVEPLNGFLLLSWCPRLETRPQSSAFQFLDEFSSLGLFQQLQRGTSIQHGNFFAHRGLLTLHQSLRVALVSRIECQNDDPSLLLVDFVAWRAFRS